MRKLILLILIGLIFTFKMEGKDVKNKEVKGQIIFENDTIDVTFIIPTKFLSDETNYRKLQKEIKYYDSSGHKKILRPNDAKEIRFKLGYENVRMISVKKNYSFGNIFLKLKIDGNLKLFQIYSTQIQESPNIFSYIESYLLKKPNGRLKEITLLAFRQNMAKYFSDCPELSKKILEKEYTKEHIEMIVWFYNSKCIKN